jgi:phenylpropionate dioxygenase-like ring-hydroxylating dioxygenase large terminal subunit
MFLRNCWYVAAWDHEVHRLKLTRRILLNEPVVLYRKSDGKPVALEDRCAHRHAPLSMGRQKGDDIECRYHGLVFDPHGKCVRIPAQQTIPPSACVKSYPVVERNHWIWIWMGDPALADAALIEDFHWMDDPEWRFKGERLHVEGNYLLVVENLCDLTHLPYLHASSLADTAIPPNAIPVTYQREGNRVRVERWVLDTPTPPYFRLLANLEKDDRVDRWMHLEFSAPAMVRLDIGAARAGTAAREGDRSQGITTRNLNAITPETDRTSHYFWAQAQDFGIETPAVADLDYQLVHGAFAEDLAIIKGQQENIDLDANAQRLNIAGDTGGLQARRIVEQLIAAERNPVKA